jgi:hypothetical protein
MKNKKARPGGNIGQLDLANSNEIEALAYPGIPVASLVLDPALAAEVSRHFHILQGDATSPAVGRSR